MAYLFRTAELLQKILSKSHTSSTPAVPAAPAWKWTDQCAKGFAQTKTALLKSEALTHFDPSLPLQLSCDTSPCAVKAVVSHIMPNVEKNPIVFVSCTLNKAEIHYAQIV